MTQALAAIFVAVCLSFFLFYFVVLSYNYRDKIHDNVIYKELLTSPPIAYRYVSNINVSVSSGRANSQPRSKYAYATFIGSDNFFPALEVFLYTFMSKYMKHPLALCVAEVSNYQDIVAVTLRILSKYDSRLDYTIYIFPLIPSPTGSAALKRWEINWTKIQLWSLLEYEKVFYVDLDVIFMRNTDAVFENYDVDRYMGTHDWGRWEGIESRKMNGGVFLMRPAMTTRSFLLTEYQDIRKYNHIEAEQGLFNFVFKSDGCCLPFNYNVQKTVVDHIPRIWNLDDIIILHFTGEKPWRSWSTSYFRSHYVDKREIEQRIAEDQWDADQYKALHDMWKERYMESRADELGNLTIYQMYHDPKCWSSMFTQSFYRGLCLHGPLRSVTDVNAALYYDKLRSDSYQMALSEFGGMISIHLMKRELLPRFVGFTSWKEHVKHDWKEGATIDWTKVDFKQNTIYFWYSLPNAIGKTYIETMDVHQKGMLATMRELLPYALPDLDSKNRYIYANYFITSREVFISYMDSAREVLDLFLTKFPLNSECPFEIPAHETNGRLRCAGYFMERYINIWAVRNNVSLVYAVDEPSWRLK